MAVTKDEVRTILVYEPVAEGTDDQEALAQRPADLEGKVVGLLNNTKDLTDVLLGEVEKLLRKEFSQVEFLHFRKESVSGAPPILVNQLAEQCDAVVNALGD